MRKQENEVIRCDQPEFNGYLCMSSADFESFYKTFVLGCQVWKKDQPKMSPQEAFDKLVELKRLGIK